MQTSAQTVDGPSLVPALLIVVHDCDCVVLLAQVRITAQNKVRNYITYAMALLEEKGYPSVVLKAMGKAINKAVVVGMSLATDTSHAATCLKLAQPWMSDVAAHVAWVPAFARFAAACRRCILYLRLALTLLCC